MKIFGKKIEISKKQTAKPRDDLTAGEDFYNASADWFYDMYQGQSVWIKRLLIAVVTLFIMLCLSLFIICELVPLKEKVPYLYAFDKATGEITKIGALDSTNLTSNWEMTRYFLTRYIISREGYDFYNIDYPYQIAWAMSGDEIRGQYESEVNSQALTSPYKMYGKSKYITVNVISISQLNDKTASIRFEKVLNDRDSGTKQTIQKEAIVKWEYEKPVTTQKMLDRNPLGFKVTYYQVSQVNLENN